jgi:hypothetical protein
MNRRSKTEFISEAEACEFLRAIHHFAFCKHRPTFEISINWKLANIDQPVQERFQTPFLHRLAQALGCPHYLWVVENPAGKGLNSHILLHVPEGRRSEFPILAETALEKIISKVLNVNSYELPKAVLECSSLTSPESFAVYMLKGVRPETFELLGIESHIQKEYLFQGTIIGHRWGCSNSLKPNGRKANPLAPFDWNHPRIRMVAWASSLLEKLEQSMRHSVSQDGPASSRSRVQPDWQAVDRDYDKGLSLKALWDKHCFPYPNSLAYPTFVQAFHKFQKNAVPAPRNGCPWGEQLYVRLVSQSIEVVDPDSETVEPAHILIAVLAASGYAFAMALPKLELEDWQAGLDAAFSSFGGVPQMVITDTPNVDGVETALRQMADTYGAEFIPATLSKPIPELQEAEEWLLSRLMHQDARQPKKSLNYIISIHIAEFNLRCGRKDLFQGFDKPALRPLPGQIQGNSI